MKPTRNHGNTEALKLLIKDFRGSVLPWFGVMLGQAQ